MPAERLYARTGTQFLSFNTLYQLRADAAAGRLAAASSMAMIPDLVGYWLSGVNEAEATNASTTGLFDPAGRTWDAAAHRGARAARVAAPAGVRARDAAGSRANGGRGRDRAASRGSSCRTSGRTTRRRRWSACRWRAIERPTSPAAPGASWASSSTAPIRDEPSRSANFTNELGVDGRIRFLRNVMGLWLLQESIRTWERSGAPASLPALLAAAAERPAGGPTFDPNDPSLLPPGDMPARISALVAAGGGAPLADEAAVVRAILDSLAAAFAATVRDAARIAGRDVDVVHLVGGGSRNDLLCRLTADALGLPVVAGPVEATAIGNLLVQARAHGLLAGGLEDLRAVVRRSAEVRRYEPRPAGKVGMISA